MRTASHADHPSAAIDVGKRGTVRRKNKSKEKRHVVGETKVSFIK